jgi:L-lactate permease
MVLWALPTQFIKNHKNKQCGVVLPMAIMPFLVCTVRAIYASQREAWGIVVPDIVGAIISLGIVFQWFKYRK